MIGFGIENPRESRSPLNKLSPETISIDMDPQPTAPSSARCSIWTDNSLVQQLRHLAGDAWIGKGAPMFEPFESFRSVKDPDTGVVIRVKPTSEVESLFVEIEDLNGQKCLFGIMIEPKFPDRPYKANDPDNPAIELLIAGLSRVALFRNGTREENTEFVRYILSGLSAFNRLWPLYGNPFFYSDQYRYEGKNIDFHFDVPPESEISML